ncbi:cytochrome C oxidase subunit III [Mizugakiibacter sediminis]|uniref:cytochrome-c oxidase n=1 Tax=Mizugakiibacter sediminis TaxID=1475481 RepID=A0A0K8QK65_9GAMM|nr:cytochrome c oxidase subunit 3 [Mizugakiibacter sediminis]GAP65335.1 cytochrome C oxidase subunit III [Mizugakiibacter sediminis]
MAQQGAYYVPHGSRWPIVGSIGLFTTVFGAAHWINGNDGWRWVMFAGIAVLLVMMFGWFGTVIRESIGGMYNRQVDTSFRMGMIWFIFSEVMFFGAFFGALFYARSLSVPWLGGEGHGALTHDVLWSSFTAAWPTNGPQGIGGAFETMAPWGIPLLNTLLLLSSGVTITIAHHALKAGQRKKLLAFLAATVLLGATFLFFQAHEYIEAYTHLNLTLQSGIYGSTFFMLTGFHGLHVTLGAIMLTVIWFRCAKGHFDKEHHFGFEAVAWYWHFVDVVWLGLFMFVYVL